MRPRNVYIVEDNELVCEGYMALLEMEPDLVVCGCATTVDEAIRELTTTDGVDVVMVDMRLDEDADGLYLIEQLAQLRPELPAIAVTAHVQPAYRERALAAGARRFLDKKAAASQLVPLLREVMGGQ